MEEIQHYEIESDRLRFRRLRADDFGLVAPILQDVQTMYAWEHAFSYEEVCDWIADMLHRYREDGCGYFAALSRQTGALEMCIRDSGWSGLHPDFPKQQP